MATVRVNGVTLGVESFGDAAAPLVLLAGGTTMLSWPDALCEALARGGAVVGACPPSAPIQLQQAGPYRRRNASPAGVSRRRIGLRDCRDHGVATPRQIALGERCH
jgi:hypothetical protein